MFRFAPDNRAPAPDTEMGDPSPEDDNVAPFIWTEPVSTTEIAAPPPLAVNDPPLIVVTPPVEVATALAF